MTRQIKFRAWNKVKNEMEQSAYSELLIQQSGSVCIQQDDNTLADVSHDYDVMQFTGLYDKNGKEIYSGDIVRYSSSFFVGEVHYTTTGGCAFMLYEGGVLSEDGRVKQLHYTSDIESIGNIYEHPHLLTTDNTTKV